jgi:hypothetical protein
MSTSFHAFGFLHLDMQLGEVSSVHRVSTDVRIDWAGYASRGQPSRLDIGEAEALALFVMLGKALGVHAKDIAA